MKLVDGEKVTIDHATKTSTCCAHANCSISTHSNIIQKMEVSCETETLTTFKVKNMDCADEIRAIQEVLNIQGVIKIQSNLMTSTVQILHLKTLDQILLKNKINTTVVKVISDDESKIQHSIFGKTALVTSSGIFFTAGLCLQWLDINPKLETVSFIFSILLGAALIIPKAINSLKRFALDMNVLMSFAIVGAIILKEYSEASAVIFLFSLSELLESFSIQRARRAIQSLFKIAPKTANRLNSNENIQEVNAEEIEVSEIIRVKAGENIPLDGVVIAGSSSINQAPLTGEFIPVPVSSGANVFAGTINQEGTVDIKVTKRFNETKISQVIHLVEEAQNQRADSQKFIDTFAHYYTPTVFTLAMLTFLIPPLFLGGEWQLWFYKSLVLLVIACPCALVISTPISIVSSLTALVRNGVLIKGGAVLETLGKIKVLAIDKTGTLTKGKPIVQEVVSFEPFQEENLLRVCASLENHSNHPLACSIVEYAKTKNIPIVKIERFSDIAGSGTEGVLDGHTYIAGNQAFIHRAGVSCELLEKVIKDFENKNYSVVIVAHKPHENCEGEVLGVIALGDQIREEARSALKKIKSLGITNIIMLSGDHQKAADIVGAAVGIDEVYGNLLPHEKLQKVEQLIKTHSHVGMIGDGINDAPAMARSSIGIAMGTIGSDVAIETSDVALMNDDLKQVAVSIKSAKRTLKIIKFNIMFALITKLIFIVLTFFGYSNLWLAVMADTGATLLVILNSLRLLKVEKI